MDCAAALVAALLLGLSSMFVGVGVMIWFHTIKADIFAI